jgi:hypothetical protein
MAFMMPTSRRPDSESGLYEECRARPIAWPMGVLRILRQHLIEWDLRTWARDLRAPIRETHEPRLDSAIGPFQRGDSCAESKTFECFYPAIFESAFRSTHGLNRFLARRHLR